MTFTRGNLQLRDHKKNNKRVLLFSCNKYPLPYFFPAFRISPLYTKMTLIRIRKNRTVTFEGEVEVANVEVTGVASIYLIRITKICLDYIKMFLGCPGLQFYFI